MSGRTLYEFQNSQSTPSEGHKSKDPLNEFEDIDSNAGVLFEQSNMETGSTKEMEDAFSKGLMML